MSNADSTPKKGASVAQAVVTQEMGSGLVRDNGIF